MKTNKSRTTTVEGQQYYLLPKEAHKVVKVWLNGRRVDHDIYLGFNRPHKNYKGKIEIEFEDGKG